MRIYACIIGSEILNGRRVDKHFEFLREKLSEYGHELFASFVIKDDRELIANIYNLIKNDKEAVMFSFGGIGSTPDDLTRAIAAEVFTSSKLEKHKKFEQDIIDRFGDEAYPYRINMANLPKNSELLFNPINNMSGFSLEDRYFFTPGFVQMSHPMVSAVIERLFSKHIQKYRLTLIAQTSENTLISVMEKVSPEVEFSSLPMIENQKISVEISLSSTDKLLVEKNFKLFTDFLDSSNVSYELL
ncbi:molybdopterin-binding protein [Sulfurimonas sp.]|uniref:competence/damage-inducible protein A n=1 Tax=Sulfurimonas sp. TaxID=2022749 RepID=UPI0025E3854F|nr:molybdopterin-binding protein [Sulfurimonas sp.]MDD5157120.1 molybdopterin-binding protein [Sulfurimonas sp.]